MEYFNLIETPDYTIKGSRRGDELRGYLTIEFTEIRRHATQVIPMTGIEVLLVAPPKHINPDNLKNDICTAFNAIYAMAAIEQSGEDYPTYEPEKVWITVTGEISDNEPERFSDSGYYSKYGDYTLFSTGYGPGADDDNELAKLNGRLNHANNIAISDFWSFGEDELEDDLKEINDDLWVVHRKGKDWYIYAPMIEHDYSEYSDLPGMYLIGAGEEMYSTDIRDHSKAVKEMTDMIELYRRGVETNGFIMNQLHMDDYVSPAQFDTSYYDLAEEEELERYFEDRWELNLQIQDNWNHEAIHWGDYNKEKASLESEFNRIYQPLLKEAKAQQRKKKTDRLVERQYLWEKLKELIGINSDTTTTEADFLACF